MQFTEETPSFSNEFIHGINPLRLPLPYDTLAEEAELRLSVLGEFEREFLAPGKSLVSKAKVLDSFNKKKPDLPSLALSAIPLYDRIVSVFYSARRKPLFYRVKADWCRILQCLSKLKYYFSTESIGSVFEKILPLFYPNDLRLMCQGQALFMWFFPYNSAECVERYVGFIYQWFEEVNNFPSWTKNWIHVLCKISSYHGDKYFTQQLVDVIYQKISFLLEKQQDTLDYNHDSKWILSYSFASKNFIRSIAKLLVNLWSEDAEERLKKYFSLNETIFHPSSLSGATKRFSQLITSLVFYMFRQSKNSSSFNDTLLRYCQMLLFSKDPTIIDKICNCLKYLSILNPACVLNWLFELAEVEFSVVNHESHRLFSSLGSLTYCMRTALSDKIYPAGCDKLLRLMPTVVSFIGAANPQKSIITLDLLFSIFHILPIHSIENDGFLFDFYDSFITTTVNVLCDIDTPKETSSSPEFAHFAMIVLVVKHVLFQIPHSVYLRLLERFKLLFTEKLFYPKNSFLPRIFGILKSPFPKDFLNTFLPLIFQNLNIFIQERDDKMIEWNLHLLCRIVNQAGFHVIEFKEEILKLFSTDFASFDNENIPRYLYKLLKMILTNHLTLYPLEYRCYIDEKMLECSNIESNAESSQSARQEQLHPTIDFTKPFDNSKTRIDWHITCKEEFDLCSLLIQTVLSNVNTLPASNQILATKAILKGIAYLSICPLKTVIYSDFSTKNERGQSFTNFDPSKSSTDFSRELFEFVKATKNRCIELLFELQARGNLQFKSLLELAACWKEVVLPKSYFPNKLQKILTGIKMLKSSLLIHPKSHDLTRALFIQRAYAYHLQRCVVGLEDHLLHSKGLDCIIDMTLSDLEQIRNAALLILTGIVAFYNDLIFHILDYLVENIGPSPSVETTKGLLSVFMPTVVLGLICNDLTTFSKFLRFIFSFHVPDEALETYSSLFSKIEQSFTVTRIGENLMQSGLIADELLSLLQFLKTISTDSLRHNVIRVAATSVIALFSFVKGTMWNAEFLQFLLQSSVDPNYAIRDYCMGSFSNIQYFLKPKFEKEFLYNVSDEYYIDKPCYDVSDSRMLKECILKNAVSTIRSVDFEIAVSFIDAAYLSILFSNFVCEEGSDRHRNLHFLKAIFAYFKREQIAAVHHEWQIMLGKHDVQHYAQFVYCAVDIFVSLVKKASQVDCKEFIENFPLYSAKCNLQLFNSWSLAIDTIYARKDPRRFPLLTDAIFSWRAPISPNYLDFTRKVSIENSLLGRTQLKFIDDFSGIIAKNLKVCIYSSEFAQQLALFVLYAWKHNFDLIQPLIEPIFALSSTNPSLFVKFYSLLLIDHCNQSLLHSEFFRTATKLFFLLEEKVDSAFNKLLADTKNTFADSPFPAEFVLFALHSFEEVQNWKIHCDNIKAVHRSFIRNALGFNFQEVQQLLNYVQSQTLSQRHADIKLCCSHFITGIVKYFHSSLDLLTLCNNMFDIYFNASTLPPEKYGAVLVIIGCLNAFPYSVDDRWMPVVLERLANITLNERSPVGSHCRKFFLDFKRTHLDNWLVDKDKFSEEQLTLLNDLLISPSYYA